MLTDAFPLGHLTNDYLDYISCGETRILASVLQYHGVPPAIAPTSNPPLRQCLGDLDTRARAENPCENLAGYFREDGTEDDRRGLRVEASLEPG